MMESVRNKYQEERHFQQRLVFAALFVFVCFGLLFARFIWLQVVHYDQFSARADTNRIKVVPLVPSRGAIIDRNGVVLAYNAPVYTVEITPSKVSDLSATIEEIRTIVPVSARDIRRFRQMLDNNKRLRFVSVPLTSHLTQEQVANLSAQLYRLPGVEVNARFIREYPLKETASHVLGYIHSINQRDIDLLTERDEFENYRGTQDIGREGIEARYESILHGTTGVEEVETTARGRPVRRLREVSAQPGQTLRLTLDIRLQRLVEELYGERRGAFVAIDPRNGEVLALVSKPTYDPNQFIEGFDQQGWDALQNALSRPLVNRAIGEIYPIGSTYKPFMALAGLQTGARKPDDITMDRGIFELGGRVWRSPAGEIGGPTNVTRAIITSSNVYFYTLAYDMGVNTIYNFMKPWGFGQLTDIDLRGEARGILPSTEWKQQAFRTAEDRRWYDGETVNLGIGQGHNRFTMIQLATAVAALANNGAKHRPHLFLDAKDVATGRVYAYTDDQVVQMDVKPEYLDIVQNAMIEVPRRGTARTAFTGAAYDSGGKTGTAQASSVAQGARYNASELAEYKRDHALYIAFAPAENPTIAVAIIVENAGFGARSAVPIVRRALDYYLLGIYPSAEDIKAVQQGYAGPPRGQGRARADYDIIPAEQLIPLSAVEVSVPEVNNWSRPYKSGDDVSRKVMPAGASVSEERPQP